MDPDLYRLGERVGAALKASRLTLATAESCTGGWVAQVVTMVPGSSGWFDRGFVTYSNRAKQQMLGVSEDSLRRFGAVTEQVAGEMARGALECSGADIAVAVSGVAGPDGGSADKPVGTVCIAWDGPAGGGGTQRFHFDGYRDAVRRQSVIAALEGLLARWPGR